MHYSVLWIQDHQSINIEKGIILQNTHNRLISHGNLRKTVNHSKDNCNVNERKPTTENRAPWSVVSYIRLKSNNRSYYLHLFPTAFETIAHRTIKKKKTNSPQIQDKHRKQKLLKCLLSTHLNDQTSNERYGTGVSSNSLSIYV